jgi:hypothetical protein
VKAAYAAYFDSVQKAIGKAAGPDDPDLVIAADKSEQSIRFLSHTRAGRQMKKRLRRSLRDESPEAVLESVIQNILGVLQTGFPLSSEGFDEVMVAGGIDAAGRDIVPGTSGPLDPDFPKGIPEVVARLQLSNVRDGVAKATYDELTTARDAYIGLSKALRGVAQLARVLGNLPNAFGLGFFVDIGADELTIAHHLPLMLLLKAEMAAPDAQALVAELSRKADDSATAGSLVSSLPPRARERLQRGDPKAFEEMSEVDRKRFFEQAQPLDLKINLRAPLDAP